MTDDVRTVALGLGVVAAAGAGSALAVGFRAAELGHELTIAEAGKRFRVECSCGWSTSTSWTRRHTMLAATEHAYDAVHGRVAAG